MNAPAIAPANGGGFRYTNPADPGECFFWSNIQNQGRWQVLRGSGLLFFHYKRAIRVNDPPNPLALAVVQADGRDDLGAVMWPSPGSDAKDFFVGGGTTEFSDTTTPSAHWLDGEDSGLRVHAIGPNGPEIRFNVGKLAPMGEVLRPDPPDVADAGTSAPSGDAGDPMPARPSDAGAAFDAGAGDAGFVEPDDMRPSSSDDAGKPPGQRPTDDPELPSAPPDDAGGCSVGVETAGNASYGLDVLTLLGVALAWRRRLKPCAERAPET